MKRLSTLPIRLNDVAATAEARWAGIHACLRFILAIVIGLSSPSWVFAQLSLDDMASLGQLTSELQGTGITINNLSITTGANNQYGTFMGGTTASRAGPVVGIENGVFMTTGAANSTAIDRENSAPGPHNTTLGPNTAGGISFSQGTLYTDSDLTGIVSNRPLTLRLYLRQRFLWRNRRWTIR